MNVSKMRFFPSCHFAPRLHHLASDVLEGLGDLDDYQARAVAEGLGLDALDALGNVDGEEVDGPAEGVFSDLCDVLQEDDARHQLAPATKWSEGLDLHRVNTRLFSDNFDYFDSFVPVGFHQIVVAVDPSMGDDVAALKGGRGEAVQKG